MRYFRPLDLVVFFLCLGCLTGSIFWSSAGGKGKRMVEIEASDESYLLPLDRAGELILHGPIGETHVEVLDGGVRVSRSDCRDKICIAMGTITEPGEWLACLPNRIFVRIVAIENHQEGGDAVDAGTF